MSFAAAFRVIVANTDATNVDEVLDFVESQSSDVSTFRLRPRPGVQAAVGDYLLVLNTVGSLASIASILWMAYDKFVASRTEPERSAGLILHLEPAHREVQLNFWVGVHQKTEAEFTDEFTRKMSLLAEDAGAEYRNAVNRVMSQPTLWIARSEYSSPTLRELQSDASEREALSRILDEMARLRSDRDGR